MDFIDGVSLGAIFKVAGIACGVILVLLALAYPRTREALAGLGVRLLDAAAAFCERWLNEEQRFTRDMRRGR